MLYPLLIVGGIVALLGVGFLLFTERRVKWDATPEKQHGKLLFRPHLELHPFSIYTPEEGKQQMAQMDALAMFTDRHHLAEYPGLYRYTFTRQYPAQIGEPAPDFDLPTTDGDRFHLADQRGSIVAFMYAAET